MPYCPICRYEYVEGTTKCPDCDVNLVAELPEEAERYSQDEWVKVYEAADEAEAEVVTGALQSAGIKVWDRSLVIHSLKWVTVGPLAPEDLLVLESDVEAAKEIIRQVLSGQGQPPPAET